MTADIFLCECTPGFRGDTDFMRSPFNGQLRTHSLVEYYLSNVVTTSWASIPDKSEVCLLPTRSNDMLTTHQRVDVRLEAQ